MRHDASRWTVSIEKAGRQTAMYSAPWGPGRAVTHPLAPSHQDGLPGATSTCPASCSTRSDPASTIVYSSNSGVCPGSTQPDGDRIRAMLTRGIAGVHPADELVDQLGLVSGGLDPRRLFDQRGHEWLAIA